MFFVDIHMTIGFLDSGMGGVNVLRHCLEVVKGHKVLYLCDNLHMPYGTKSKEQIKNITIKNVHMLIKRGATIIVIACNTGTACAIKHLRVLFPKIVFVGVEPNIKEPIKKGYKKIAILCTKKTAQCCEILKNKNIDIIVKSELATYVEQGRYDLIYNLFDDLDAINYDAVVLGCTHYSLAAKQLKEIFVNADFFDGLDGVKARLSSFINSEIEVILTQPDENKYKQIKTMLI